MSPAAYTPGMLVDMSVATAMPLPTMFKPHCRNGSGVGRPFRGDPFQRKRPVDRAVSPAHDEDFFPPERFEGGEVVMDPVSLQVDEVRDVQLPGDERPAPHGSWT